MLRPGQARIEEELAFLPLTGRLNRRAGERAGLSRTEQEVVEAWEAGEETAGTARRAARYRASVTKAISTANTKRA